MAFEITITNAGRAAIAALTGTDQVVISQIGVSQTHQVVSWATTALTNETKRLTAFGGSIVDAQTMSIQMLDDSADSYNLRSFALYTSTGVLFAIYSPNEIISAKSAASLLLLQIDITLTALGTASITFGDTNFVNPPASDTLQGVARFATQAETIAGALGNVIVSPAALKAHLDQNNYVKISEDLLNEQNGYIRYANGLKECWGFFDIAADNHATWLLPTPHTSWVNPVFGHTTYDGLVTQTEDVGIVEIIKAGNIPTAIKFWNGQNASRRVYIQTKGF